MKLTYLLYYPGSGGAEQYVFILARHALAEGYMVEFVFGQEGPFVDRIKGLGINVTFIKMRSPFDIIAIINLIKFFRVSKTDIAHTMFLRENFLTIMASKFSKTKVVSTVHRIEPKTKIQGIFNRLYSFGLAKFITSPLSRKLLLSEGISSMKIIDISNGIEIKEYDKEKTEREIGKSINNLILTYVARLSEEKGHCVLLGAVDKIKHSNLKFCLVGDGPLRKKLKNMSLKLKSKADFVFIGNRNDGYEIIGVSDVYIQSSFIEVMPLSVIEAMFLEVPVIASDIEAHKILLKNGEYGTLFKSGDSKDLAKKIDMVLGDLDKYKQKALMAKKYVEKKYTAEIMWKNTKKVYLEAINDKK